MFHILVVEDDIHTRQLLCAVLRRNGFAAVAAPDGIAALEAMGQDPADLVVVDLMMPRLDGYALTRRLRETWPALPILIVTAKQTPVDKRQGFLMGTDDYMTKPVDEEEMVLRIRALLRRSQIAQDRTLTVGDVRLDCDALSVSKGDDVRALPQKEFQLLFKLLSSPGMIFTRIQLMDDIWGPESETDDHTLNVHISRLRSRFLDWPDFEILAVRGLGYKAVRRP